MLLNRAVFVLLVMMFCESSLQAQVSRRQPIPPVRYELGPDSLPQDNVPSGRLEGPFLFQSKIIENTIRKYWISVPAQYDPNNPACLLVFQDGARAINPNGVIRVPQVLDNLIAAKKIPVTIGIYITPGQRGTEFPDSIGTGNPDNRDREYDVLDDKYARMLIEEILPEVGAKYKLTDDPAGRTIGGSSSGGICAFTVAWHRPDAFRNVVSFIGSFTDIHGGHVYPQLIRENPAKPIRIFLQDGENDNRSPNNLNRDWFLQNQAMVAAFTEKKYDMAYVFGKGPHADDHGGAMLPEMLQWIWRDYPGIQNESAEALVELAKQRHPPVVSDPFLGLDPNSMISPVGQWRWETNINRFRSTQFLTIEGDRSHLRGQVKTVSNINGQEQSSETPIQNVEIVGNKLMLDFERSFGDRKFTITLQGIVGTNSIVGWSMSEQNGVPRDTAWRAERVTVAESAQYGPLGIFEKSSDVGPMKNAGSTKFNPNDQTYELSGSGINMWGAKDEFHFVWRKVQGDFILDAQAKLLGDGVDPHRKLGCIIRSSLDGDSAYADAAIHGDGLTSLQYRKVAGGATQQVESPTKAPKVVRLSRKGNKIAMQVGKLGEELQPPQVVELDLGKEVYVGLFVCSHSADVIEKGLFSNVRITIPASAESRP